MSVDYANVTHGSIVGPLPPDLLDQLSDWRPGRLLTLMPGEDFCAFPMWPRAWCGQSLKRPRPSRWDDVRERLLVIARWRRMGLLP